MAANRKFLLATNRGFAVHDNTINIYVATKNVHYAEVFPSMTKAIIARHTASKDMNILEQDIRILEVMA